MNRKLVSILASFLVNFIHLTIFIEHCLFILIDKIDSCRKIMLISLNKSTEINDFEFRSVGAVMHGTLLF